MGNLSQWAGGEAMDRDQIGEEQGTIEQLMSTPVGRRWLLKAGLSAFAVAALPRVPAWAANVRAKPTVRVAHHFALGAAASLADLKVVVNGQTFPLTPHTSKTRSDLRGHGSVWRKITPALTHFATVTVPRDQGVLMSVHGTRAGKTVVVAQKFHAPEKAVREIAKLAIKQNRTWLVAGSHHRLTALGLDPSQLTSVQEIVDLDKVGDTEQTAIALTMCHPSVATIAPIEAAATKSLLGATPEVGTLGHAITLMQQAGEDFATLEPAVDAQGNPSQITIPTQPPTITTFSTFRLNKTDPTFTGPARSAFIAGIVGVRDTGSLGTVVDVPLDETSGDTMTWHQPASGAIVPTPYSTAKAKTGKTGAAGAGVGVQIQNTNLLYGTYTALNGALAGSQVPLKLYNNYVRWISVYVQYLAADGTNLSLSSSPSSPDTQFAKHLGLLPQVFTMLGVPLWDSNTIEVTLDFPPGATSARLLFCGLGTELKGNGWRQYFPADAYPDSIAPSDEVLVGGLLTGIVSLGLTAFALATDFDIATTLKQFLANRGTWVPALSEELGILIRATSVLTGAEALATAVAAGDATYTDVTNNDGDLSNLWSILGAMGSAVPKLLFGNFQSDVLDSLAEAITTEEVASKLIEAIPVVGELYEVVAVLGDVATLAQAIGETVASPWVIANQVSLTYSATVTVSRDSRAATWPVTARTWRIEAKIDGAAALAPVTGTINAGGKTQIDPIPLSLTAPFGGKTITWSMVLLDAAGHQVGSGAAQFANDDANNLPLAPTFAITELPAVITPATTFRRTSTTVYSPTAGGYTWAPATLDNGTIANSGVQEVTGVAVATRLGVAGIVWKQNHKYWLRGVPIGENGTTIRLGGATRQGYARRPFLLFDALVGAGDIANHVLLEPDDIEPGYHVRRLAVDPTSGQLSWDPALSLGYFTLLVSAATLHSSGHVAAVHTDFGRLGRIMPVNTQQPLPALFDLRSPLASYTAGSGTQVGLLSSPTAIAVMNPGTLIVLDAPPSQLDAAPAQLAAFDLNGNPVRQFGTASPAAFTLNLVEPRTYHDVAVDGAGQIYVLSHQGNGSQPVQYRIDVFSPTGAPISVLSIANNIPHLAVDYWRSIYAANFTALLDASTGQPRIDPALGVAEPSLSRWDPS
jgi:hypothetical protein